MSTDREMAMRPEVQRLVALGRLPAENLATVEDVRRIESELASIVPPLSKSEAHALVCLFGPDGCFGLAWSVLHLVESAPGWPIDECLAETQNPWVALLKDRASRGSGAETKE